MRLIITSDFSHWFLFVASRIRRWNYKKEAVPIQIVDWSTPQSKSVLYITIRHRQVRGRPECYFSHLRRDGAWGVWAIQEDRGGVVIWWKIFLQKKIRGKLKEKLQGKLAPFEKFQSSGKEDSRPGGVNLVTWKTVLRVWTLSGIQ